MTGLRGTSLSVSGLALALAAVVFGGTALDALRLQEPPADPGGSAPSPSESGVAEGTKEGAPSSRAPFLQRAGGPYPRVTQDELLEAVNQDLFQPDRTPPLDPYRLPGERTIGPVIQPDPRRAPGPEIRVVGAALMGDLAVALVQVDDSIPLALGLGESVEGYTLVAVDQEGATLVGETETLTLPVVPPLLSPSARSGDAPMQVGPRDLEAMQERVQQLLRSQMLNQRGQGANRGRGGGGQP